MKWNDDLLPDQEMAASHLGTHARLLAGPGTGKTLVLTRRIIYLINEKGISPEKILALTFTRAAAQELRKRVEEGLGERPTMPRIYTLHAFALRQLLRNSKRLNNLPQPLRIADDWEERNIIQEDLKTILGKKRVKEIQDLFNQLSSDWETLAVEKGTLTPDPKFIGAWQNHRKIFGYTLRSELVFQLKRALEQIPDFELEKPLNHLIIDEFQDLNKCDLSVVDALVNLGLELFVAGDDDQSIYGFRNAQPEGIRRFLTDHPGAIHLSIEVCKRCDSDILELAQFVADLDINRIPKRIRSEKNRSHGEVAILTFSNQFEEATAIASLCEKLIKKDNYSPSDILILSRVNTHNAFSRVLETAFQNLSIPLTVDISKSNPLDENIGRIVLSILRLLDNQEDGLAWRTLLGLKRNRIGKKVINSLIQLCQSKGYSFYQSITKIKENQDLSQSLITHIIKEVECIDELIQIINQTWDIGNVDINIIAAILDRILSWVTTDLSFQERIKSFILNRLENLDFKSIQDVLLILESTSEDIEQEIIPNSVNMLTMHKAKGLTSKAVIILAAEDELIPGRQSTEPSIGDERRLLFVSLTRAKHKLFITYCNERTGQQMRLGRNPNNTRRNLTQFLQYSPVHAKNGIDYINKK